MNERYGKDNLDVGAKSMQAEHKSQFAMVDSLCEALRQGRSNSDIDDILEQVIDYTHVHFMGEQLLMRLHAYPQYDEHCREHAKLLEQFRALREGVKEGTVKHALESINRVREYLNAHIGGSDRALSDFLEELDESVS